MLTSEIMTRDVVTVSPGTDVRAAARLMTDKNLGGLPVVTPDGHLVGMVTEGDLLHRVEIGTEQRRSRWARFFASPDEMAKEYAKAHGLKVLDVMSRPVIAVRDDAQLSEIANTLDKNHVKRVPVVRNGVVVGIISRRDLVRVVARPELKTEDDASIQHAIVAKLRKQQWLDATFVGIAVKDGNVEATGFVSSAEQHEALLVLLDEVPGVSGITDNLVIGFPRGGWA